MSTHIDSFQEIDTPTRKTRYEDFRAQALRVGRYSIFEATANATAIMFFEQLEQDPEIETDRSCGYPWIKVRRKRSKKP